MERCANCQRKVTTMANRLGYCAFCGYHLTAHIEPLLPRAQSQTLDTTTGAGDGQPTPLPGSQNQKRLATRIGFIIRWPQQRNRKALQSHEAKLGTEPPDIQIPSMFGEQDSKPKQSASLIKAAITINGERNHGFFPWVQRQPKQLYIIIAAIISVVLIGVGITSQLDSQSKHVGLVSGALAPQNTATASMMPTVVTGVGQQKPTITATTSISSQGTVPPNQPTSLPPTPSPTPAPTWRAVFQASGPDCNNPNGVSWNHLHANNSNVITCSNGSLLIQQGQTYYPEDDLIAFPNGYDPKLFQAKVHAHFHSINSSTYAGTDATLVVQAPANSSQCGGYYWEIRPNGNWRLQSLSSGCAYSIVNSGWVGAAADYNMEVQVQNGTLNGFINGARVISIVDSLNNGIVGLSVINWAWPTAQVYYTACEIDAWK